MRDVMTRKIRQHRAWDNWWGLKVAGSGTLLDAALSSLVKEDYRISRLGRRACLNCAKAGTAREAALALEICALVFSVTIRRKGLVTFKCPRIHRKHLVR